MSEMAKIKIKLGQVDIEYEGESAYMDDKLLALITSLVDLVKHVPIAPIQSASGDTGGNGQTLNLDISTNTIASKIGAKSCSDLVIAASAYLAIVQGKPKFKRKEISDAMKTATTFYKASFKGGNLSGSLETLVKGQRLLLQATDEYALSASELKSLEAQIVG